MEFSDLIIGARFSHEGEFYKKEAAHSAVSEDTNEAYDFAGDAEVFSLDPDDDEAVED